MHHQVGTVFQRFHEPRGGEGGVDQKGHACFMCNLANGRQVQHVHAWIANGLAKEKLGIGLNRRAPRLKVAWLDESGLNAKAAQGVVQQVV